MIEAISRGCKGTLSDGTIRYVFDIAPKDAASAAELFGMPGSPVVLARLTQDAAIEAAQAETIAAVLKGGGLARWAGILCNDPMYWKWLSEQADHLKIVISNSVDARMRTIEICGVMSRVELDHDRQAGITFREQIMAPFSAWKEAAA